MRLATSPGPTPVCLPIVGSVTEQRAEHHVYDAAGEPTRDRPWIIRTYAGHSSPKASNKLYRKNLAAGQML